MTIIASLAVILVALACYLMRIFLAKTIHFQLPLVIPPVFVSKEII